MALFWQAPALFGSAATEVGYGKAWARAFFESFSPRGGAGWTW